MRKTLLLAVLILAPLGMVACAPDHATETVTLRVWNISTTAGPVAVRKALEKVPGVTKIKVDFDTRNATVTFDPAKAKVEDLIWATGQAGFPSRKLSP